MSQGKENPKSDPGKPLRESQIPSRRTPPAPKPSGPPPERTPPPAIRSQPPPERTPPAKPTTPKE